MLPPGHRLRANRDFRSVYARAKSHVNPLAVLYGLSRSAGATHDAIDHAQCRIGFVVSKKMGGAATRNRIKRRLRSAVLAAGLQNLDPAFDVVIVGRRGALTAPWDELKDAVAGLLRRCGAMR